MVSKEPMVYGSLPNNNNNERADLLISAHAGVPETHGFFGMFDLMTKVVSARHTNAAINIARAQAQQEGITDTIKIARREIQAGLKVGYDQKIYKYRFASQAGIKVLPLIISTAGVMHSTFYKFIHKIFPDSILRSSSWPGSYLCTQCAGGGSRLLDIVLDILHSTTYMYIESLVC